MKLLVREEGSAEALELAESGLRLLTPDWILAETANALWKKHFRERMISHQQMLEGARTAFRFDLDTSSARALLPAALELAMTLQHPVYDCLYLALALAEDMRLITADKRFCDACAESYPGRIRLLTSE